MPKSMDDGSQRTATMVWYIWERITVKTDTTYQYLSLKFQTQAIK